MWVAPFFDCGECGGEIGRWPVTNLLRQEVLDWRHRSVPAGVSEHRAVLGTPAHRPQTPAASRGEDEPEEADVSIPEPEKPAHPCTRTELPRMARRFADKAEECEWAVQHFYMRGPTLTAAGKFKQLNESVVVRVKRYGLTLVACWSTLAGAEDWAFDGGWQVGHWVDPVTSTELNTIVTGPRARCEDCGEDVRMHVTTDDGPICHRVWQAALNPTPEESPQ